MVFKCEVYMLSLRLGIPIYQQNLIFQSRELKDMNRLGDAGIRNGSTLTLVASMRGGPISTRRLSVACEHHVMLKELKELLENTRWGNRKIETFKMPSEKLIELLSCCDFFFFYLIRNLMRIFILKLDEHIGGVYFNIRADRRENSVRDGVNVLFLHN